MPRKGAYYPRLYLGVAAMKHTFFKMLICFALFLPAILSGCAHGVGEGAGQMVIASSEAFKHFSGEFENTDYFRKHKPVSIAVAPFQDLQKKNYSINFDAENPANIVRRGMYNHIASLPFRDLEIYDVDNRLKNAGLSDIRKINEMVEKNPKKLGSLLGVDAIVTGEVTHFDRVFLGIYSQVAVGCEVKMWDLKSGKMLWRAKQVSRAHAGGVSLNPVGLIMATVASVWNLRQSELLSQTDELFREIVSTVELPESALAMQKAAPRMDLFATLNAEAPFTLAKKIAFRVIGDPNCKAYVDLGDYKAGIKLTPVAAGVKEALRLEVMAAMKKSYRESGHTLTPELIASVQKELATREIYEGTYTVEAGQQKYGLLAKAYLVDSGGGQSTAIDPAHTIDIDSRPPQKATGLKLESLDNKIIAKWDSNADEDLADYEIFSSQTPLSGYQLAQKTEANEAIIGGLENFAPLYFKVRAIDRAKNTGAFSPSIKTVPLPEPGLYSLKQPGPVLGGDIAEKVLLTAAKNPYTVFSDVRVVTGGVLFVEPGVKILFAPDTVIETAGGDLRIYGQTAKPVKLAPKTAGGPPGAWQGVVIDDSPRSLLRHVAIERAVNGISIKNSAPNIVGATVVGCSQAGLQLLDNAKPNITCSVFRANEGQGAMVIEGEGLAPVIRNNTFVENSPFQVQSYTPLEIDLSGNYWGSSEPEIDWFLGNLVLKPVLVESPANCK
jgi:hypothetical protein